MKPSDLARDLEQGALRPIYLVYGEEPLQKTELHDALLKAVRAAGYSEREILEADRSFDWSGLAQAADSLSLFAEKRLIELRVSGAGPGRDGGPALVRYTENPPPDTILLVLAGALDWRTSRSAWFQALGRAGAAVVECASPPPARLPAWVGQRMRAAGLRPTEGAVQLVCERVEGNLLAADQEIKKLALLGGGDVDEAAVLAAVADSARYNPYDVGTAALAGDTDRCARMILGLMEEGVAPTLVHWVLRNEARTLLALSLRCARGESQAQAFAALRVYSKRQPGLRAAMQRLRPATLAGLMVQLARLERGLKGMDRDSGESKDSQWLLLLESALRLAGADLPMQAGVR